MKRTHKPLRFILSIVLAALAALSTVTVGFLSINADEAAKFYVNQQTGNDSAAGTTADSPLRSLGAAQRLASASGRAAVITLLSDYKSDDTFEEVAHENEFTITAANGAKLIFGAGKRYKLRGDTVFDNIAIHYGNTLNIVASFNSLTLGAGVTTHNDGDGAGIYIVGGYQNASDSAAADKDSHITVNAGDIYMLVGFSRMLTSGAEGLTYTGTSHITVGGGTVKTLIAGSISSGTGGSTEVTVSGGEIGTLYCGGYAAQYINGSAKITLTGGKIPVLAVHGIIGNADLLLNGAEVGDATVSYRTSAIRSLAVAAGSVKTLTYNPDIYTETQISSTCAGFDVVRRIGDTSTTAPALADIIPAEGDRVRFIKTGGSGDGGTPKTASDDLAAAYKSLCPDGGTIVVCGGYKIESTVKSLPACNGKITLTSTYGGVDFAETAGAYLHFDASLYCGADTEIRDIHFKVSGSYRAIYADGHSLTVGGGVTSELFGATTTYLSIIGGKNAARGGEQYIEINSGVWQRIRLGNAAYSAGGYKLTAVVNGGEYREIFNVGSNASSVCDINATLNGGIFCGGVCASANESENETFNGDIEITINGGEYYGAISASSTGKGKFTGSFNLYINGGEFAHTTDIDGASSLDGDMTSTLTAGKNVDINAAESGKIEFTNPLTSKGADPWLFECDGFYYYTYTAGASVKLYKLANIADLRYAVGKTIFKPEAGHPWSNGLASPEFHHYTDGEAGEGNGGWYCFVGARDTATDAHCTYVLKCLDGDDLLGRWGHPVTGEVNVPQRIIAEGIDGFYDAWVAGQTDIKIGGQMYIMYVTVTDKGTPDYRQIINIAKMKNPWTIDGGVYTICEPEYDWEKHGGAQYVVEGGTAVYADDGTVYIVYTGSGYWTEYYALGQMKYLGGDPLQKGSWEKLAEPILSLSDNINGCGHACYLRDLDGSDWICYHAYIGKNTTSGRYAFVEPYKADKNGVVIGDGTRHPADINTVYTVNVNPMPLADKISSFDSIAHSEATAPFTSDRIIILLAIALISLAAAITTKIRIK